ncbi:uncharacterized protein N7503_006461 [Penicillium pulvis]|uniref:uncharacterized protein n=1 Tax=Penicillium pulvis TaxID=1562058 RepID=UPI002546F7BF|nr:uncharacterized protein N7503_006461 [Penicillium pulvis]KAJ5798956.1 hypothetical protein N7503_006461 [Penicillium pulvis]
MCVDNTDSWRLETEAKGRYKANEKCDRMEGSGRKTRYQECPSITHSYLEEYPGLPDIRKNKRADFAVIILEDAYQLYSPGYQNSMAFERTRALSPSSPPAQSGMAHVRNSRP